MRTEEEVIDTVHGKRRITWFVAECDVPWCYSREGRMVSKRRAAQVEAYHRLVQHGDPNGRRINDRYRSKAMAEARSATGVEKRKAKK